MRVVFGVAAIFLMAVVFVGPAQADYYYPMVDPSFENTTTADGSYDGFISTAISSSGWFEGYQQGGKNYAQIFNPTNTQFPKNTIVNDSGASYVSPSQPGYLCNRTGLGINGTVTNGTQVLIFNGPTSDSNEHYILQQIGTMQAHSVYTLTLTFGAPADRPFGGCGFAFWQAEGSAKTQTKYMGDTVFGADMGVDVKTSNVGWMNGGTWAQFTFTINTDNLSNSSKSSYNVSPVVGDPLYISIYGGAGACVDNVSVLITPEPATCTLMATAGVLGVMVYAWRRRRRKQ